MEFWVLVWLVANPWNSGSFNGTRLERYQQDGKIAHFEVFKSTPEVMERWGKLSIEERQTARIFNGNEHKVTERIVESTLIQETEKFPLHTHCNKTMRRVSANYWQCIVSGCFFKFPDDKPFPLSNEDSDGYQFLDDDKPCER